MITFSRASALCLSFALSVPLSGAAARAQSPDPSGSPPARPRPSIPADLLVPIHTHPDDPTFGPYGTWAVGPDYKVSFHDGFAFYPQLAPSYPQNLPLAWHLASVRVGDQSLLLEGEQPRHVASPWRSECRYRDVVEAYAVRGDGVGQTFVLAAPPAAAGDLVLTGRVATRLQATQLVA